MENIQHFFENIKKFNIWFENDIVDEFDDIYELYHEIECIMYCFNDINDIRTEKYLKDISGYYIKDTKDNKIYFTEFVPYIYEKNNEWRMKGDEKYLIFF